MVGEFGVCVIVVGGLRWLLLVVRYLVRFKYGGRREKLRSFECGFEPMVKGQRGFCLRFFIVRLMFLVFDIELAMLIMFVNNHRDVAVYVFVFVLILLGGVLYEIHDGNTD